MGEAVGADVGAAVGAGVGAATVVNVTGRAEFVTLTALLKTMVVPVTDTTVVPEDTPLIVDVTEAPTAIDVATEVDTAITVEDP